MAAKKTSKTIDVDQTMLRVAQTLIRDFQENLNDPLFCSDFLSKIRTGSIREVRDSTPVPSFGTDAYRFKATYQLQSLFKRWRFESDLYSDEELIEMSVSDFEKTQSRLRALDLNSVSAETNWVLNYARCYIADTLGVYDAELHHSLCRFGRKASVGVPARLACLAQRWEQPISGSLNQIKWFEAEMSQIPSVCDYLTAGKSSDPEGSTYHEIDSLKLTLVPKTFKALRAIMPNTTIGGYSSYGLGEMMRKGLKRKGYDIRRLQMRHRDLARSASIHNQYVTADLSSASDSITVALVQALFPADWFEILNSQRIGKVELPDHRIVESCTFCTMGIGYTFPLQTLVFLALLKGIETLLLGTRTKVTISVYGDDMIYHRCLHDMVCQVFGELGFILNVEKTFVDGGFRESCGGDYYHGVDVRPFQPRKGQAKVGHRAYEAMLYKFINTLLMRWTEHEIGSTLTYLLSEVESLVNKVKVVPCDYPDDAGVKVEFPLPAFLDRKRTCIPKHVGHGVYRFSYLSLVPETREENRHVPYLWEALRDVAATPYYTWSSCRRWEKPFARRDRIDQQLVSGYEPPLIWREAHPIRMVRSKLTGIRYRRLVSLMTISHTGRYTRQSGFSCFEDRR